MISDSLPKIDDDAEVAATPYAPPAGAVKKNWQVTTLVVLMIILIAGVLFGVGMVIKYFFF